MTWYKLDKIKSNLRWNVLDVGHLGSCGCVGGILRRWIDV